MAYTAAHRRAQARYYAKHKTRIAAKKALRRAAHKPEIRATRRAQYYGATPEWVPERLKAQEYKCAICRTTIDETANLDHNHETGKLRGMLCQLCNLGLGHFKDSEERLLAAVEYLRSWL